MDSLPRIQERDLNTFRLEVGVFPDLDKEIFFINGRISLDEFNRNQESLFSLENKRRIWGKGYKDNKLHIRNPNGTIRECVIPGIIIGGMGTGVSSSSLIEAGSLLGVGGHLSSIGIGGSYQEPSVYSQGKEFDSSYSEVLKKFDSIFVDELGISREMINKHFFECEDGFDENFGITGNSRKEKMFRMKDLIAIYEQIISLKEKGINCGINAMYKTTSYDAVLKVATLAGISYITTSAGNPNISPRDVILNFLNDIGKINTSVMPAFGLIVSIVRSLGDVDYDYYIIEDPIYAGGHLGARDGMLDKPGVVGKYSNLISLRKKVGEQKPIYVAGGLCSAKRIEEAISLGADGVQIGTVAGASDEAVSGGGKDFKKRLISGNHVGKRCEIDKLAKDELNRLKKNIADLIVAFQVDFFNTLGKEFFDDNELSQVMRYIHKVVFGNFYLGDHFYHNYGEREMIELDDSLGYSISAMVEYFVGKYPDERVRMEKLRQYGDLLKFAHQISAFDKKGIMPTHIVFDSVVGFDARKRLSLNDHLLSQVVNTRTCVGCLNSCILSSKGRKGAPKPEDASRFCIVDSLEQGNDERKFPVNFSGLSTVPYPEIRPFSHNLAAMLGYEVVI